MSDADTIRSLFVEAQRIGRLGTFSWDLVSGSILWSDQFFELLGRAPGEVAPTWEGFVACVHPDDREHVQSQARQIIAAGVHHDVFYRVVLPSGAVRHWVSKGRLEFDGEGRAVRMVGFGQDITTAVTLERERTQRSRMETLGQLAGGIAHDFNNILSVVVGNAGLLASELSGQPTQRELVEEIIEAGRRARDLTGRLLAFARKQVGQPVSLDAVAVVRELGSLLRRLVPGRVALTVEARGRAMVLFGRVQLEQVVLNLVSNARDAIEEAGAITVRAGADARDFVLEVVDTGSGIPADVQGTLFEPFVSTKGERGTGLGLANVRSVLEEGRGQVRFTTGAGEGTTFTATLPLTEQTVPPPALDTSRTALWAPRVMVVDGNPALRLDVARVLGQAGHEVLDAVDVGEALRRLDAEGPVQLVLMGAEASGLDTFALAARQPGLRVLWMTDPQGGGPTPVSGPALRKPFTPGELLAAIAGLFQGPAAAPPEPD